MRRLVYRSEQTEPRVHFPCIIRLGTHTMSQVAHKRSINRLARFAQKRRAQAIEYTRCRHKHHRDAFRNRPERPCIRPEPQGDYSLVAITLLGCYRLIFTRFERCDYTAITRLPVTQAQPIPNAYAKRHVSRPPLYYLRDERHPSSRGMPRKMRSELCPQYPERSYHDVRAVRQIEPTMRPPDARPHWNLPVHLGHPILRRSQFHHGKQPRMRSHMNSRAHYNKLRAWKIFALES